MSLLDRFLRGKNSEPSPAASNAGVTGKLEVVPTAPPAKIDPGQQLKIFSRNKGNGFKKLIVCWCLSVRARIIYLYALK